MSRSSIFLSHATPEDNAFTRWLAGKLTIAGYRVWHDLDRLKGGDLFWDKIEAAIRNETYRLIAIVSETSYKKPGVRNEWDLAMTLERSTPGFLIPVRIDCFDFSLLPITIHRKNVIDFAGGWHKGLATLLDTLAEADAPRLDHADPALALQWLGPAKDGAIVPTNAPETLESNWLPIIELPQSIESTQIRSSQRRISATDANRRIPWFELGDRIVGLAKGQELVDLFSETVPLKVAGSNELKSFVTDGITWGENRVLPSDARYRVSYLIRQAWDLAMEKAGLKEYALSGDRVIRYVPSGLRLGNRFQFSEAGGRVRRKDLAGHSAKYKVNWHYAVAAIPMLDDPWRIELRAHIVFTDEMGVPLESAERMHQLRRSFCRNWWNDRWRGFLKALLAHLADGKSYIELPVGQDRVIRIGAEPIGFSSPSGLSDLAPLPEDDPVADSAELPEVANFNDLDFDEEDESES